jgi:hypothetical protein
MRRKLYKYNLCIEYTRMVKKKLKDEFKEFRNNDKSAYKTFKIPLKSILQNRMFSPTRNKQFGF